jgi:uncharacterized protein YdeI (YjbR/CyaY-like superfamily)
MKIVFFPAPADLRKWFEKNHATADELWVGYYKKTSGKPSVTWPESVDQALCFGWIDGIRKTIDDVSYRIRFTPRRPGSIWSTVNIKRANVLIEQGQMKPAGKKAFAARKENRSGIYAYEQRSDKLAEPYEKILKKNKAAFEFFSSQPSYYRKVIGWWIVSAKKEETRLKRLEKLIEESARGRRIE